MHPFRLSVAFAVLLLAGFGCGKKESAAPTTKESKPAEPTGTPTLPTAAANTGDSGAAALKAATDFLKAVQEGKATSASLTPAFKKAIAPPELEADKAVGYSESGVQAWLTTAKATATSDGLKIEAATADFAFASAGGVKGKTYLRLLRVAGDWLIDYAISGAAAANATLPGGEQAGPAFAASAFADALIVKNFTAVEALLTKAARAKLAPPLFETDKEQGYSRSKLQSALGDLLSGQLTVASLSFGPGSAKIELSAAGVKKSLDLKLVSGPTPGSFLIDDLQQK
jgi:hypothetical protein